MTFKRPTLGELVDRARGDIQSRLPGADAALRHSVLDVLARTHAGGLAGLYGYLDHLALQLMPDTADGEHLARWAAIWGLRRKAALRASVPAIATGLSGPVIPAGALLVRPDGSEFVTLAAAELVAGQAMLMLEASEAGAVGAPAEGSQLTFANPLPGVNAVVTAQAGGIGGADEEGDAALLARLLARIRQPPQGGAAHDYVAWTLAQPGVTRAWAWPGWMGTGTVGVSFVMDDRADILPLQADLDAVEAALDALRPVTAQLVVFAPTPYPVHVVLRVSPSTPEVEAAISAELDDFFAREGEPGGTIHLSRLSEAVSLAAGEFRHVLELPEFDVEAGPGEIPVLGSIQFAA